MIQREQILGIASVPEAIAGVGAHLCGDIAEVPHTRNVVFIQQRCFDRTGPRGAGLGRTHGPVRRSTSGRAPWDSRRVSRLPQRFGPNSFLPAMGDQKTKNGTGRVSVMREVIQ